MIEDIEFPEVKNVTLAVVKEEEEGGSWKVYLINKNEFSIENTLVTSKGYGEAEGEKQMTSTLRHFLETVPANNAAIVESIDPAVFHLNNEYWVSYYVGSAIYDKRFLFVPDVIREENMTFIKELDKEGVLHS
ncbi:hypothetical protein MASR2M41_26160 [Flammeovirgaceae bacterium]